MTSDPSGDFAGTRAAKQEGRVSSRRARRRLHSLTTMTIRLCLLLAMTLAHAHAFGASHFGKTSFPPRKLLLRSTSEENEPALKNAIENLVSIIDEPLSLPSSSAANTQFSEVHIIGTGLCPTLLNLPLSTLHVLSKADVVLYDSLGLSLEDICRLVPKQCEVICVGKRGDKKSWKQTDINNLLLQKATEPSSDINNMLQRPKSIVRLKGGDPFLFGRTKTEIEALRSHNIPYSYTPGISSCIAGPHLGGIPLTDPSLDCQSFGVWSGTDAFGKSWGLEEDDDDGSRGKKWQGLGVDVLIFLMIGRLDKLEALCQTIANGGDDSTSNKFNKDTPCAIIQNAGSPAQRVWRSKLENFVSVIKKEDETRTSVSPAVFVVGATASLDLLTQS